MRPHNLSALIARQKESAAVLDSLAAMAGDSLAIEDSAGRRLRGEPQNGAARYPIRLNGDAIGWVTGTGAEAAADVISHLATREAERKTLGAEVLHLYREVNLIYTISERLAARLEMRSVAELTLSHARHLLGATDGAVLVLAEDDQRLEPIATFGDRAPAGGAVTADGGLVASIVASGQADVVLDVASDPRRREEPWASAICAPLKVGERVTGAIVLATATPAAYTAGDLKLLNTIALQTATAIENARLFERAVQAARERERLLALHKELELAARIQADLFPAVLPAVAGYEIAARNRSARQCGGNYYDVLPLDASGRVLFCVADVSGKGLPASLLMSNTQATLRALLGHVDSLSRLASRANELLHATTSANKYVTAALLELDPGPGRARYVSAGHTDCLHVTADGEIRWLRSTGAPLGLLAGVPYDETSFSLEPGDAVALFSDGVPEAQNEAGDEFGEARLASLVQSARDQPAAGIVEGLFAAIDAFAGHAPQYDDVTLLVIRRAPRA